MRDYRLTDTVLIPWSSNGADGGAIAPSSVTARIYKDDSTTEITTGVTNTSGFDGLTGLNMVTVDIAAAGLTAGSTYKCSIEATIDGVTARKWIGQFSVRGQGGDIVSRGQLSAAGTTTFTLPAGQRADVRVGDAIRIISGTGKGFRIILTYNSGTGAGTVTGWDTTPAASDYYEVVALPTAEQLGSADFADGFLTAAKIASDAITAAKIASDAITEIQTGLATAAALDTVDNFVDTEIAAIIADLATVKSDLDDIQTRIPAALVGGRMDSSVGAMANNVMTAAAAAADLATELQAGLATQASVNTIDDFLDTEIATIVSAVADIQSRLPAALVGGRIDASVGAMAANTLTASALATDAVSELVTALFAHEIETGHSFARVTKNIASTLIAKSSKVSNTRTFRNILDTADQVTATTDADGQRTAVTLGS